MNENMKMFQSQGYCIVQSAISDNLRDFITQYALFDEMQNFSPEKNINTGGGQVPEAHSVYADPAMESMLLVLHSIMEENTGLKLLPTYSYYRVYRNGDKLEKHKDRESCEISCTLCFNYNYNDLEFRWPIFIEGNPVKLEPGDMVVYRGCELDHWREPLVCDNDAWQVQGFFHYVDANGPFSNFVFDQRSSLGVKNRTLENVSTKSYIQYTNIGL